MNFLLIDIRPAELQEPEYVAGTRRVVGLSQRAVGLSWRAAGWHLRDPFSG